MCQSQRFRVFKLYTLLVVFLLWGPLAKAKLLSSKGLPEQRWRNARVAKSAQQAALLTENLESPRCGVEAVRIIYETTDSDGTSVRASGLLQIPTCKLETYPMLNYNHATRVQRKDAPSTNEFDPEALATAVMFATYGFIVALPDYLGLGQSEGRQIYLSRNMSARMVRDFLEASVDYLDSRMIKTDGSLFIAGYSQGAHVSLSLLQDIEKRPLRRLKPVAAAGLGGIYELDDLSFDFAITKGREAHTVFTLMTILSQSRTQKDPSLKMEAIIHKDYIPVATDLLDGKIKFTTAMKQLPKKTSEIFHEDFLLSLKQSRAENPLIKSLALEAVDKEAFKTPILLYVSEGDELSVTTESAYQRLEELGSPVVLIQDKIKSDHVEASLPALLQARKFFSAQSQRAAELLGPTHAPINE